jgi:hypothetical protein
MQDFSGNSFDTTVFLRGYSRSPAKNAATPSTLKVKSANKLSLLGPQFIKQTKAARSPKNPTPDKSMLNIFLFIRPF